MNAKINIVNKLVKIKKIIKTNQIKSFDRFLFSFSRFTYIGIKTLFTAPSANILLKRLGSRYANKKASDKIFAPKKFANKTSLTKPVNLEPKILEVILEKLLVFIKI